MCCKNKELLLYNYMYKNRELFTLYLLQVLCIFFALSLEGSDFDTEVRMGGNLVVPESANMATAVRERSKIIYDAQNGARY